MAANVARSAMLMVTVKAWIQREKGLASRSFAGVIIAQTAKAICFRGRVAVRESVFCMRCGRPLTNPTSRLVGYGPECCEQMGLDRPDFDRLTAQQIDDLRRGLRNLTIETWFPKTQIVEVLDVNLQPLSLDALPVCPVSAPAARAAGPAPVPQPRPQVRTERAVIDYPDNVNHRPGPVTGPRPRRQGIQETISRLHHTPLMSATDVYQVPGEPNYNPGMQAQRPSNLF